MGEVTVFVPDGQEHRIEKLAADIREEAECAADKPNVLWASQHYTLDFHEYVGLEPVHDNWPHICFDLSAHDAYSIPQEELEAYLESQLETDTEFQNFKDAVDRGDVDSWIERHPFDEWDMHYTIYA